MVLVIILDCGQELAEEYNRVLLIIFLRLLEQATPVIQFKLSASTLKDIKKSEEAKIRAIVNTVFNMVKTYC